MAHAEKCPVCGGTGKLLLPIGSGGITGGFEEKPCHGCAQWGSHGWIVIDDIPVFDYTVNTNFFEFLIPRGGLQ